MTCYLPKKQHQTLNEALEIVVLGNRTISIQRDVTEYLSPTERKRPWPKGQHGISNLFSFRSIRFDSIRFDLTLTHREIDDRSSFDSRRVTKR